MLCLDSHQCYLRYLRYLAIRSSGGADSVWPLADIRTYNFGAFLSTRAFRSCSAVEGLRERLAPSRASIASSRPLLSSNLHCRHREGTLSGNLAPKIRGLSP